jgi:hypothetical protein
LCAKKKRKSAGPQELFKNFQMKSAAFADALL